MSPVSDVLSNDPSRWREQAKQLRTASGATPYREETRLLLELAEMYDRFAADIETRQSQIRTRPAASIAGKGAKRE